MTDKTFELWREHARTEEYYRLAEEKPVVRLRMYAAELLEQNRHLQEERRITQKALAAQAELVRQMQDMIAYVDLHIGEYPIRKLTTEQRELWADSVDASGARMAKEEGWDDPRSYERWWREDYVKERS